MDIAEIPVTIKGQITIPIEYRKMLGLDKNPKIFMFSMRPGEVKFIGAPKKIKNRTWAETICGKYADDSWDSLEELKKYKKEDLELEKRGIID